MRMDVWRRWMTGGLLMLATLPGCVQAQAGSTARVVTVAARKKKSAGAKKAAPAVTRAQVELAQQMARNAYALGVGLEPKQRVALMTRLLYTMRPEVMAAEKRQWAEEMFGLAQKLPGAGSSASAGDGRDGAEGMSPTPADNGRCGAAETGAGRETAIATAAARLAVYDADRALEVLDSLPASQDGDRADARRMAARLVFAGYMQHHGAAGAQALLAHGRKWSEQGGFPYSASAAALARLRPNEDAAEDFFRQTLTIFEKGQEGLWGVSDFASLLQQAAAMEAIFEDTAEEAGRAVVAQLRKFAENEDRPLTAEQRGLVAKALYDVRISAPKAYEEARKTAPGMLALRGERDTAVAEVPKVDLGLQTAFHEVAAAMRGHAGNAAKGAAGATGGQSGADELHAAIARGLQVVNARYRAGACADWVVPDGQSWALVSLAAYASPSTIATQLNGIEDPFWHAYFLAIAAQQVGEPTRVADPTARKVAGKEVAEPE